MITILFIVITLCISNITAFNNAGLLIMTVLAFSKPHFSEYTSKLSEIRTESVSKTSGNALSISISISISKK